MTTGPWAQDILTRIINVHWGNLYLVVQTTGGNNASHAGPGGSPSATKPSVTVEIVPDKGVTLLDEYHDPDGNSSHIGNSCFQYMPEQTGVVGFGPLQSGDPAWADPIFGPVGTSAQQAYDQYYARVLLPLNYLFPADADGHTCTARITQAVQASEVAWSATATREETWYVSVDTVPVDSFMSAGIMGDYLYSIPEGDNLIKVTVAGVIPTVDGVDSQGGGAALHVYVYSTAREAITKLSQLNMYRDDEEPKLDADSGRTLFMNSGNQGTYQINVHIDNDATQTDNYGKTFHPYKVTFDPTSTSTEFIPEQPPQLLPLPGTAIVVRRAAPKADAAPPPADEWVVKSVNSDSQQTQTPNGYNTITVLDSVTYHNPSTGETVTVPVQPG